jgi:DNA gyrase/topoisomerase IV subunit A
MVLWAMECLDELGAQPDARFVKSAKAVERVYTTREIPPRYAYDTICSISARWLVHVRLIEFHGNLGSTDDNDNAAGARYTEVRLTRAGAMALAAERGDLPPLPIGLINGDLAFGGTAPPFDPARLVDALRAAAAADVTDAALVEMIGLPAFPINCAVDGDLAALASGARTRLRLSADVAIEADHLGSRLVISQFPFGVGPQDAAQAIASLVDAVDHQDLRTAHPGLYEQMHIPLRDVRNESVDDTGRLVCELLPDADPDMCRDRILEIWPVTTEIPVQLRAPLPTLLRRLVDGSVAQREAIAELLAP